jgi:hypothetical protein
LEKAEKTEQLPFKNKKSSLSESLQVTIGHFRSGEDSKGIEALSDTFEKLEQLVEINYISGQPQVILLQLLPILRKLYFYMKNQDITGITDLLEDALVPLTEEMHWGCDKT